MTFKTTSEKTDEKKVNLTADRPRDRYSNWDHDEEKARPKAVVRRVTTTDNDNKTEVKILLLHDRNTIEMDVQGAKNLRDALIELYPVETIVEQSARNVDFPE